MLSIDYDIPIEPANSFREWLQVDNRIQHKWVTSHLFRKGEIVKRNHASDFKNLLDWSYTLRRSAKNELLIRKMKEAWRQKSYRDRQQELSRKPCSILLSLETKGLLDELAVMQGTSISQTIEGLIKREAARRLKKEGKAARPATQKSTKDVAAAVAKNFEKMFE